MAVVDKSNFNPQDFAYRDGYNQNLPPQEGGYYPDQPTGGFGGGSKTKKILIFVLVVLILLGALGVAGYFFLFKKESTGEVGQQTVAPTSNEPVDLIWWTPDVYGHTEDVYDEIIDSFEDLHQNVSIELVTHKYSEVDYYQNLLEAIAKGAGPDIFSIRNDDLAAYKDYMLPITAFQGAELTDYKDNFIDFAVSQTMLSDEVYAVTSYIDNLQVYYNNDLLKQAGIPQPAEDWDDLEIQIDMLRDFDSDGDLEISPISLGTGGLLVKEPNIEHHYDILPLLILQNGGQIYDYKTQQNVFGMSFNESTKESNYTYKAIEYYLDYSDRYDDKYSWDETMENNLKEFVEGRLAYMINYKAAEYDIEQKNPRLDYEVSRLFQLDEDNKITFGKFFMDGVSRKLEDPELVNERYWSEQFLLYLSSEEAQTMFESKTKLPAARKDINFEQKQGDKSARVFAEGALWAQTYYKPDVLRSERLWTDLLEKVKYKNVRLEDAFEDAIDEYADIVRNGSETRRAFFADDYEE